MSSKAIVCDPGKMTVQALYISINAFPAFQSKISVVWCYKCCTLLELTPLVGATLKNVVSPSVSKICQPKVVCGVSHSCFVLCMHKPRAEFVGCMRRGFFLRVVFKVVWWSYCFLLLSICEATSHSAKWRQAAWIQFTSSRTLLVTLIREVSFVPGWRVWSPSDQFLFLWPVAIPKLAYYLFCL